MWSEYTKKVIWKSNALIPKPNLRKCKVPTFAPQSTEEVKSDGDGATGESNAVKTAADALGIDDVTAGKSQSGAGKKVIVLDAGHGKSSSEMTSDEKTAEGYEYNESKGNWGEWRHYKNGTFGEKLSWQWLYRLVA